MFYLKIHAANIEASKFFVFVFVGDHGKLFLKISQMQVVCICYIVTTFIYFSESRVARNTILIQRDDLWTGKINDGPGSAVMKEEDL